MSTAHRDTFAQLFISFYLPSHNASRSNLPPPPTEDCRVIQPIASPDKPPPRDSFSEPRNDPFLFLQPFSAANKKNMTRTDDLFLYFPAIPILFWRLLFGRRKQKRSAMMWVSLGVLGHCIKRQFRWPFVGLLVSPLYLLLSERRTGYEWQRKSLVWFWVAACFIRVVGNQRMGSQLGWHQSID